ncbi:unnamed protein product [marine sediment metagenome]|uniref:Uncharacterized protein n=1 Tax=marine sediment metagenome TaxID=412755 RepID=X1LIX8_9ZZZZ
MNIFKFLKKKPKPEGLKKARYLNLITEEEFFNLKIERSKKELKEYLKKHKE